MHLRHVLRITLPRIGAFTIAALVAAIAGPAASAAAIPAMGTIRNAGGSTAVPDSYIVVLKDGSSLAASASGHTSLASRYDATVQYSYSTAVRGFSTRASATAARQLAADPAVAYVEQNHLVRADDTQLNPPAWGLDRVDQRNLPLDASFTYPAAGGQGVRVYIVDSGIRVTHQDFGARAVNGIDLVDGGPSDDCHGHGTHVAGTAGGTTYGVAKRATLVAVRVFDCAGTGDLARVVAAVDWITANAVRPAVVNMSLGYPTSSNPASLETAVTNSIGTGITYSVSAGNDNGDACTKVPAKVPAAITVAASQVNDGTWPSSNEGPCVDLFAPGLNILSAHYTTDTASFNRSGTSMSAPHVAGAAALILAANPTWTPQQVRDEIVARSTVGVLNWVTADTVNRLLYVAP